MSVSLNTLEKLKSKLQEIKDIGHPIKADLYTHLTEVFNRIMLHHPDDAYDKLEEISGLVKKTNFKIKEPSDEHEINKEAGVIKNQNMILQIQMAKNLLDEIADMVDESDRHLVRNQITCVISDYMNDAEMLEQAGVGFGPNGDFMIQKSLKRLAKVSGASKLKFFGKVLCTGQDYFVAQGILNESEEPPRNTIQELRGAGANSTVFWVTHDLRGDWIQLPDVQPEQVMAAKMVKKVLSGNLNASIDSCPPFPGKERNLLRAQLSRIQHTCEIVPKGIFEVDEETKALKYGEEAPDTSGDYFKSLENWVHYNPYILKAGRCTHPKPKGLTDEEAEEAMAGINEKDGPQENLRAISENTPVPGVEAAWLIKSSGDSQAYNKLGGEGTVSYAVSIIRSLRWPGAVTVAKNGQYCSIYVGDSIKRGDSMFNPTEPPEVMADPNEQVEQPEPQGKEEPPKEEPKEGEGGGEGEEEKPAE